MRLDLRELIATPGGKAPFAFEMDLSDFGFDGVKKFMTPVHVRGEIQNHAGLLELHAELTADMLCECARCLKEFPKRFDLKTTAFLTEELEDEDNEDYYLLEDGVADLEEIARNAFVLNFEQRILCREDCKGLCYKCGKDLNDGPCDCGEDQDPRWAALGQLLGNND